MDPTWLVSVAPNPNEIEASLLLAYDFYLNEVLGCALGFLSCFTVTYYANIAHFKRYAQGSLDESEKNLYRHIAEENYKRLFPRSLAKLLGLFLLLTPWYTSEGAPTMAQRFVFVIWYASMGLVDEAVFSNQNKQQKTLTSTSPLSFVWVQLHDTVAEVKSHAKMVPRWVYWLAYLMLLWPIPWLIFSNTLYGDYV